MSQCNISRYRLHITTFFWWRERRLLLFSFREIKIPAIYGKPNQFAMKMFPAENPCLGLRLMALLIMCCTILVHISALDKTPEGLRRGEVGSSNRVSADGPEAAGKQLHRERRAVKNNATSSLAEVEKRLKAMEERYAFEVPYSIPNFEIILKKLFELVSFHLRII